MSRSSVDVSEHRVMDFQRWKGLLGSRGGCEAVSVFPSLEIKQGFGPCLHGCVPLRQTLLTKGSSYILSASGKQMSHCLESLLGIADCFWLPLSAF